MPSLPLPSSTGRPASSTGFTLIELAAVILVIGVLVAVALSRISGARDRAYVDAMRNDLHNFALAQEIYFDTAHGYAASPSAAGGYRASDGVATLAYQYDAASWTLILKQAHTDVMCAMTTGSQGGGAVSATGRMYCSTNQPILFTASGSPGAGQTVSFDAGASLAQMAWAPPEAGILPVLAAQVADPVGLVAWDFGDGSVMTGPPAALSHVTHTFHTNSPLAVRIVAVKASGVTYGGVQHFGGTGQAATPPAPPSAHIATTPATVQVGDRFAVSADGTAAAPGDTLAGLSWDFGDGAVVDGWTASHAYLAPGERTVTLTARSGLGGVASASITVVVLPLGTAPTDSLATGGFTVTPLSPTAGDPVVLSATDSTPVSYQWDFADFTTGQGRAPIHRFMAPGAYDVTLRVTTATGGTNAWHQVIPVSPHVNTPPVALVSLSTTSVLAGELLTYTSDGSTDADSLATNDRIVAQQWDFGDGSSTSLSLGTHAWSVAGHYRVTVTVTDRFGAQGVAESAVDVAPNDPPHPSIHVSGPAITGATEQFDATATPGTGGAIAGYRWDFGDGASAIGPHALHHYQVAGTDTVVLTAYDNVGLAGTDRAVLAIAENLPPVVTITQSAAAIPGAAVSLIGMASDPDDSVATYHWDFGDGTPATTEATASHVFVGAGSYQVVLTATDVWGVSASASRTVSVAPGPTAVLTLPATAQAGRSVTISGLGSFAAAGQSIVSYHLAFGDGSSSDNGQAGHVYTSPGVDTVTLLVTSQRGLSSQATGVITVLANRPPVARFTLSTVHPNPGVAVAFDASGSTDPDGVLVSYAWTLGDGTNADGPLVSHVFGTTAVSTVTLTVTDDAGGTASATSTVQPNSPPTALFGIGTAGASMDSLQTVTGHPLVADGHYSTDSDGTIASYAWDWGDGTGGSAGSSYSHTYLHAGRYLLALHVTDDLGATDDAVRVVTVTHNLPPVVDFTWAPAVPLEGTGVQFVGTATDPDGLVTSYAWDFDDGGSDRVARPLHTYATSGLYGPTLTVTDDAGGVTVATHTVRINAPPTARLTINDARGSVPVIQGAPVTLNGTPSTDSDGSIVSYAWTLGDGATSTDGVVTHQYHQNGTLPVRLTVTDDQGASASDSGSVVITTSTSRLASMSWTPVQPLPGQGVQFTGTATNAVGTVSGYAWDFGDFTATSGSAPVVTHVFSAPGAYSVKLSITDAGGSAYSATQSIMVYGPPVPAFSLNGDDPALTTGTTQAGYSNSVDASASTATIGTLASYAWSWGDGTAAGAGSTATHVYAASGTVALALTVTDSRGATAVAARSVRVAQNTPPVALIHASTLTPAVGTTVFLSGRGSTDADGQVAAYAWTLGDGASAVGGSVSHSYAAAGRYVVTLTVTDNAGATGVSTVTLDASPPPVAHALVTPSVLYVGQAGALDGTTSQAPSGSVAGYAWALDGPVSGTVSDPTAGQSAVVFYAPGAARVVLTVTDNAGVTASDTAGVTIHANTAPVADFTWSPQQAVVGEPLSLQSTATDAEGNITAYAWDAGFGGTLAGASASVASVVWSAAGSYTVRLVVTDAGGLSGSVTRTIYVDQPPHAQFTVSPAVGTTGIQATFTSTSTDSDGSITAYDWALGDGATATGSRATHAYAAAATYAVHLTVTDNFGVSQSVVQNYSVGTPPAASFTATTPVTPGSAMAFDAGASTGGTDPVASYRWDFGDGSTVIVATPGTTHSYRAAGPYRAVLTVVDAAGRSGTTVRDVIVNTVPVATATGPGHGTATKALSFSSTVQDPDAGATFTYDWNWGDGSTHGTTAAPQHVYQAKKTYTVTLTVMDNLGGTTVQSLTVRVT